MAVVMATFVASAMPTSAEQPAQRVPRPRLARTAHVPVAASLAFSAVVWATPACRLRPSLLAVPWGLPARLAIQSSLTVVPRERAVAVQMAPVAMANSVWAGSANARRRRAQAAAAMGQPVALLLRWLAVLAVVDASLATSPLPTHVPPEAACADPIRPVRRGRSAKRGHVSATPVLVLVAVVQGMFATHLPLPPAAPQDRCARRVTPKPRTGARMVSVLAVLGLPAVPVSLVSAEAACATRKAVPMGVVRAMSAKLVTWRVRVDLAAMLACPAPTAINALLAHAPHVPYLASRGVAAAIPAIRRPRPTAGLAETRAAPVTQCEQTAATTACVPAEPARSALRGNNA